MVSFLCIGLAVLMLMLLNYACEDEKIACAMSMSFYGGHHYVVRKFMLSYLVLGSDNCPKLYLIRVFMLK